MLGPLRALVSTFPSALVGYSGGVDSALLAVVLRQELGRDRVLAAVGRSPSYPEAQWAAARSLAERFDLPLLELETHELDDPDYVANPTNRCFFCKTELWRRLVPAARARGLAVVCDGTNADDLREHRPGYAAGQAAGVRSPLAELGLTKGDVRTAARELGLPVWDAPAAPCLSSRVAYVTTGTGVALVSKLSRAGLPGSPSGSRRCGRISKVSGSRRWKWIRAATVAGACSPSVREAVRRPEPARERARRAVGGRGSVA